MIEPASKQPHKDNPEVDNTTQKAKLSLVHIIVSLELLRACRKNTVIEVDKDVGESHECEYSGGGFAVVLGFGGLFLHGF